MKTYIKYVIVVILVLIYCGTIKVFGANNILNTNESTETIRNPERGFYKLVQVELSKDKEDLESFKEEIEKIETEDEDVSMISFQLNLKNYVTNTKIETKKLQEIQEYFDIMREKGYKVIFRVVYDSEGKENPEPEFDKILEQMDTLKEIYTNNKDILYVVEAGYLGAYGEWHDGKYDENKEYRNQIIKKLLEIVPSNITINLRKPSFITDYTEEEINENNAFSQIDVARLGLHNDGYLASETDYGTFEIDERDESLLYQHNLTKYTSFGGESTKSESKYNNFENAIEDMKYRHCSYLNKTYDREVKEKWKKSTYYSNTDIYSGQNGYKYIQDHLGYRFVLREVKLKQEGDSQRISMKLENTGFGNIINPKDVEIIYKQGDTTFTSKVETDIRKDLSKEENISNLNYLINLPKGIKPGNYDVYIKISEPYESLKYNTKYNIQFANINIWNENIGANFIGNVTIEENIEADENSQNSSFEKNNNDVLFIQTILKIALIIVILMIILIIIYKIMANKDKKQ